MRAGCFAILLCACAAPANAGETADTYAKMLQRYDALNDELLRTLDEVENGTKASPYPKRMLSANRNAAVTIGGELRSTYAYADASGADHSFAPGAGAGKFDAKSGDLAISTARVSVDARAGERWRAFVDINLNGHSGFRRARDEIDVVNQAYIELMKAGHSGFGAIFGKVKLPFGLWNRPKLFAQSFTDAPGLSGSYLNPDPRNNGQLLPYASRFIDPAVAAMLYYEMRDIVRFDASVFQEQEAEQFERRDNAIRTAELPPLSWQVGGSVQPLEGWELTAHFRNRHSRARGVDAWTNTPSRWDFRNNLASAGDDPGWDAAAGQWSAAGAGGSFGATRNEQALIIGVAAEIPSTKLSVSVEYAHGWNQGFNERINSDSVNVALAYALTPRLTLHAQGEWLHVKDGSWMARAPAGWTRDTRSHHLYRAMIGAQYELARNMILEAGWQYEYWRTDSSALDETRTTKANMIYAGTRFMF